MERKIKLTRPVSAQAQKLKVNTLARLVLLSLLSLCTLPGVSSAAVYYVDATNGNDANDGLSLEEAWKTINYARDTISGGDTVYVRAGDYGDEEVYKGNGGGGFDSTVTFEAYQDEVPDVNVLTWNNFGTRTAGNFKFEGFKFFRAYVNGYSYIEFNDCNFVGDGYKYFYGYPGGLSEYSKALELIDVDHVTVVDCNFTGDGNSWAQEWPLAETYLGFDANNFGTGHVFAIHHSGADDSCNITINNCTVDGYDVGFNLGRAVNSTITNNTIRNLTADGIQAYSSIANTSSQETIFAYNQVYNLAHFHDSREPNYWPESDGVNAAHNDCLQFSPIQQDYITIRGNKFHTSDQQCIFARTDQTGGGVSSHWLIENNLIYNIMSGGLRLIGHQHITLLHNTLDCRTIFDPQGDNKDILDSVYGNIFYEVDFYTDEGTTVTDEDYNIFYSVLFHMADYNWGSHSINLDKNTTDYKALFEDYGNHNLTLVAGSAAIDFGDQAHAPVSDILGVSRDIPPDAGCYEYVSQNPDNNPPVLQPIGSQSVDENTLLTFTVTATDPEGDTIVYLILNKPTGASFVNQTFEWTPTYDQAGTYHVTFIAIDLYGAQDSETVTITVNNVNRSAQLDTIGNQSGSENQTLSFSISASDPDGDDLTYTAEPLPAGAVLAGETFTWTPGYDQAGAYPLTFTVSDGQAQVSEQITITIANVNRSPVLEPLVDRTVYSGSQLSMTVNASDPDGDTLQYSASGLPTGATFSDRSLEWTPSNSQGGDYTVTFVASDGQLQDSQAITITVSADDIAPQVASSAPADGAVQVPLNNLVTLNIVDADAGVDTNSVTIKVNDNLVYTGNTTEYSSAYGRCYRTGTPADYKFVYQAAQTFNFDQTINVTVNAEDLCANVMSEHSFSFETEMLSFGENQPVNSDSLAKDAPATVSESSGNLWTAWHAGAVGARDIYIAKLAVAATSFAGAAQLTESAADQCNPAVTIDSDGRLHVVWQDNRSGNWDIYVRTSLDGTTWSAETRVTDSQANEINPAIVADGASTPVAYVAWQDDQSGYQDIYVAASSNGFVTKTVAQVTSSASNQREPALAADSSNTVYVFWTDSRNGSDDIYGAASNSGPWINVPVVAKAAGQSAPAVGADQSGSVLHILWVDDSSGNKDIYYAASNALPASPLNGDNIIDDTTGADQSEPAVVVTGSTGNDLKVFACWKDERNVAGSRDTDIYMVEIGSEENVFVGDDQTDSDQSQPAIGIDSYGYPYLVWSDNRATNQNVYYAGSTFAQPTALAAQDITVSSGGTVGTDPAAISNTDDVSVIIPAGASSVNATITISQVVNPAKLTLERFSLPYEFGPSAMEFSRPVTVTIPYTVPTDGLTASAYWYNPLTGTLSQQGITDVRTIVVSPTLHALQFKTTHFTQFFVGSGGTTGSGGGGGGGGCAISTCEHAGILEFMLPYIALAVVMTLLKLRDAHARSLNSGTRSDR